VSYVSAAICVLVEPHIDSRVCRMTLPEAVRFSGDPYHVRIAKAIANSCHVLCSSEIGSIRGRFGQMSMKSSFRRSNTEKRLIRYDEASILMYLAVPTGSSCPLRPLLSLGQNARLLHLCTYPLRFSLLLLHLLARSLFPFQTSIVALAPFVGVSIPQQEKKGDGLTMLPSARFLGCGVRLLFRRLSGRAGTSDVVIMIDA
jgi:hypothetical protein